MKQIGEGMDYLHNTMKMIHRDLKVTSFTFVFRVKPLFLAGEYLYQQ